VQRLRHQLREYFPAALEAFEDLAAPDALELLGKAPDPGRETDPRAGGRGVQAGPPRHLENQDQDTLSGPSPATPPVLVGGALLGAQPADLRRDEVVDLAVEHRGGVAGL
jgi:hypothetical protein